MAQYCNTGDTARVTFPSGVVVDYTDTPITIACETEQTCSSDSRDLIYTIKVDYMGLTYTNKYVLVPRTANYSTPFFVNALFPYDGYFIQQTSTGTWQSYTGTTDIPGSWKIYKIFLRHGQNIANCSISNISYGETQPIDSITNIQLIEVKNKNTGELIDINNIEYLQTIATITVTGSSGNQLFQGTFDDCGYSVECIEGCPPNHLDCGDCCLPCDEIFNSISSSRELVSRIR